MSIFPRARAEHLRNFWAAAARALLPAQDCLLCGAESGESAVCAPCEAALARPGEACVRCALPLPAGGACGACLRHPFAFARAHAAFDYRFPVDRVVRRFKYHGDLAAGAWLAQALARSVGDAPRPDLLVATPLAAPRLRERGFNQALELARAVARRLDIALDPGALQRTRATAPQPGLGRAEREANLRGAFACRRTLPGLHVGLVDDVVTTGATAQALARTLLAAGAREVSVWMVARTPRPGAP